MSGIGGRAPRHLPVWGPLLTGRPIGHVHRHANLLGPWRYGVLPSTRRTGPMPKPADAPGGWRQQRDASDIRREARQVLAEANRREQRAARIAAGVDRSSPDAGPRPRWSR